MQVLAELLAYGTRQKHILTNLLLRFVIGNKIARLFVAFLDFFKI